MNAELLAQAATATPAPAAASTGSGLAGLIFGVIGTVLAAVSLTWQVAEHRLTGSRLRAGLKLGAFGLGGAVTMRFDHPDGLQKLAQQGFTDPFVAVEAVNKGRFPAVIDRWAVAFPSGASLMQPGHPANPPLPHRLEGGASVTFYAPLQEVLFLSRTLGEVTKQPHDRVRAEVGLATGKSASSGWEHV